MHENAEANAPEGVVLEPVEEDLELTFCGSVKPLLSCRKQKNDVTRTDERAKSV